MVNETTCSLHSDRTAGKVTRMASGSFMVRVMNIPDPLSTALRWKAHQCSSGHGWLFA